MSEPFDTDTESAMSAKYRRDEEEYRKRQRVAKEQIQSHHDTLKGVTNICLAFLIDATSSMQSAFESVRNLVYKLPTLISHNEGTINTNFLITLYRDPVDSTHDKHETFSSDCAKATHKYMNEARAYGGGDNAEDVAGGVECLNALLQKVDKDQTLLVIHILDAPGHGFHHGSDNHNTEVEKNKLAKSMADLRKIATQFSNFEYHFYTMIDMPFFATAMEDFVGDSGVFKEMRAKDKLKDIMLTNTFSVVHSISKKLHFDPLASSSTSSPMRADYEHYGVNFDEKPSKDNICTSNMADSPDSQTMTILKPLISVAQPPTGAEFLKTLIEHCRYKESFGDYSMACRMWWSQLLRQAKPSLKTDAFLLDHPVVFMNTMPFGKGAEHVVFHGKLGSLSTQEAATSFKNNTRSAWKSPDHVPMEPVILKFSSGSVVNVQPKLEIFAAIRYLLDSFNALNMEHKLRFTFVNVVAPFIMELSADTTSFMGKGKPVFVSPQRSKIFEGAVLGEHSLAEYPREFTKYLNNDGVEHDSLAPECGHDELAEYTKYYCVLHAFVLYCWHVTQHTFVPSDLQGKLVTETDYKEKMGKEGHVDTILLTDLACSANNQAAFDSTVNLGVIYVHKIARKAYKTFSTTLPTKFEEFVNAIPGASVDNFNVLDHELGSSDGRRKLRRKVKV